MYKLILMGLLISASLGYFAYSQNKINNLIKENAETKLTLDSYVQANNMLIESINKQNEQLTIARRASVAAEQRAAQALEAFNDSDLNYLSQKKPELIERIINEGTKDVLNQINTITSQ
jgi:hypothetical protein